MARVMGWWGGGCFAWLLALVAMGAPAWEIAVTAVSAAVSLYVAVVGRGL